MFIDMTCVPRYLRHRLRNMDFVCGDLNLVNVCSACPQVCNSKSYYSMSVQGFFFSSQSSVYKRNQLWWLRQTCSFFYYWLELNRRSHDLEDCYGYQLLLSLVYALLVHIVSRLSPKGIRSYFFLLFYIFFPTEYLCFCFSSSFWLN